MSPKKKTTEAERQAQEAARQERIATLTDRAKRELSDEAFDALSTKDQTLLLKELLREAADLLR